MEITSIIAAASGAAGGAIAVFAALRARTSVRSEAAQAVADRLLAEAERKATEIEDEAEGRAVNAVDKARQKNDNKRRDRRAELKKDEDRFRSREAELEKRIVRIEAQGDELGKREGKWLEARLSRCGGADSWPHSHRAKRKKRETA